MLNKIHDALTQNENQSEDRGKNRAEQQRENIADKLNSKEKYEMKIKAQKCLDSKYTTC